MSLLLLFPSPPVTPTLVGSAVNTAGANVTNTATVTLPTVQDGDQAWLIVSNNSNSTETITTEPVGWAPLDVQQNSTVLRSRLYSKTLTAGESGATVSAVFSVGYRWTMGVVVVRNGVADVTPVGFADTTDDLALSIPAITPTADDDLLITLAGVRYTSTTSGVAAAGNWTEQAEQTTTNATAPVWGVWAGTRQLAGGAGVSVAGQDMTFAATARANGWVVAVKVGVAAPPTQTATPDLASSTADAPAPSVTTAVTVVPDLATSTPAALAPTVSTTVTVSPGLTSGSWAAYLPTVSTTVTVAPGLATSTPTAFDPAVTVQAAAQTVTPGLASSTPAALTPAASTTVTVSPGLASSTPAALAPAVTTTVAVTPGLASSSPAAFAPVVTVQGGPITAVPNLAASTPTAHAPTVTTAVTVTPGIATSAPQAHAPTVTQVAAAVTVGPGVAVSAPQAYAPTVTVVGGVDYTPHVYVTATVEFTPATATLASNGVGTADLAAEVVATAVLQPFQPATAQLDPAVGTAALASNGVSTATLVPVDETAELVTV